MGVSNDTVLVFDLGLWVEDAVRFAIDAKKVIYHVPNREAFREPFKSKIGEGLDGVETTDRFWDWVDKADFIHIPDNTCADMVEFLKKHDYPVSGVGDVEKVETDRWYGRQKQADHGLPVQASIRVVGVTELSKLMKEGGKSFGFPDFPKQFYVKVDNNYRGVEESFKHERWSSSEDTVYRIASRLGPFKETVVFICEELLEGQEPGLDGCTWEGELMFPTMGGYEGKGVGIIERVYHKPEELPPAYHCIHDGLANEFRKHKTRFFYSVELRIDHDRVPYLIDPTLRKAGPGTSAIQCEIIENYTEMCKGLATGDRVDPIIKNRYGAACAFHSEEAVKDWVQIWFPKELRRWVKLRMGCRKNGKYYAIPGFDSLGTVIGFGQTPQKAVDIVKGRMEEVKAKRIDTGIEKLEKILCDIEEGKKVGINF